MFSIDEGVVSSTPVVAFLHKLWTLVNDETYDHLICWGEAGASFHILDPSSFAKTVLPQYFKHANIASFIRQLNMYGFRKVTNLEQGGLKADKDDLEFAHPYFLRGREDLLELIKRKVSVSKSDTSGTKVTDLKTVLEEVRTLRTRQDSMSVQLGALKRENGALWRELAMMWQRHTKQQQVVAKLLQFLVSLCRGQKRIASKRSLMAADDQDTGQQLAKLARMSNGQLNMANDQQSFSNIDSALGNPSEHKLTIEDVTGLTDDSLFSIPIANSPEIVQGGLDYILPVVSPDLAEPLVNWDAATDKHLNTNEPQYLLVTDEGVLLPATPITVISSPAPSSTVDEVINNAISVLSESESTTKTSAIPVADGTKAAIGHNNVFSTTTSHIITNETTAGISNQLEQMQCDLDTLEELLGGLQYNFSNDTLKGLFTPEAPLPDSDSSLLSLVTLDEDDSVINNNDNNLTHNLADHLSGSVTVEPVDDLPGFLDLDELVSTSMSPLDVINNSISLTSPSPRQAVVTNVKPAVSKVQKSTR